MGNSLSNLTYTAIVERMAAVGDTNIRVVHYDWTAPVDQHWTAEDHGLLDICLTPRPANARACYEERWASNRFEPLGDVIFFPPGVKVRARGETGQQRALQCYLPFSEIGDGVGWGDGALRESLNLRAPAIRQTCSRIEAELYEPGFAAPVLIKALCQVLTVEIIRHFSALPPPRSENGGLSDWRMKRIEERVALDGPPPSIEDLSILCGIGRRQLMRSFKQSRHESIFAYITRTKLDRAKHLLRAQANIAEVSFRSGFASPSNFSSAFKRETGTSPRFYQDAHGCRPLRVEPS